MLAVHAKNVIEIKDVLLGEVWLCSGQSNMEMEVGRAVKAEEEIAAANYPQIRMFFAGGNPAEEPQPDCPGDWKVCSPATVAGFSATAYFFGRELHRKLGVPVGLLRAVWGDTPIEAWTALPAQRAVPELAPLLDDMDRAIAAYDPLAAKRRYQEELAAWETSVVRAKDDAVLRVDLAETIHARRPSPVGPHAGADVQLPDRAAGAYAIRGAIWYQGERNAPAPKLYSLQLGTMIGQWRRYGAKAIFPFSSCNCPASSRRTTPRRRPAGR